MLRGIMETTFLFFTKQTHPHLYLKNMIHKDEQCLYF